MKTTNDSLPRDLDNILNDYPVKIRIKLFTELDYFKLDSDKLIYYYLDSRLDTQRVFRVRLGSKSFILVDFNYDDQQTKYIGLQEGCDDLKKILDDFNEIDYPTEEDKTKIECLLKGKFSEVWGDY